MKYNEEIKINAMKKYAFDRKCFHCLNKQKFGGRPKFIFLIDAENVLGSGGNKNCIVCKQCRFSYEVVFV